MSLMLSSLCCLAYATPSKNPLKNCSTNGRFLAQESAGGSDTTSVKFESQFVRVDQRNKASLPGSNRIRRSEYGCLDRVGLQSYQAAWVIADLNNRNIAFRQPR